MKKLDTGQSDILVLADVPPTPQEGKCWTQVKVTFWFWLMYPPPEIEIGLNMNAIGKKSSQERSSSTFYQSAPPFHYHYLILCLNRKLVNFNFKWIYGLEPHPPPLSSQKNEMLIFGLHSTSDDWPGCSMDSNPFRHPSPAKKMKCLFSDYVQLLMISWAG